MKKIYGIIALIFLLIISVVGITYSYEYYEDDSVVYELLGPYELYLNINDIYKEYGIKVFKNDEDISSLVKIDSSLVDTSKIGEYNVIYEIIFDDYSELLYRKVYVRENIKPVIKLLGDSVVELKLGQDYIEPGYEVTDNYDVDLYDKVEINSDLIYNQIGEYSIIYKVVDSSGNKGIAVRKIIIK